MQKSTAPKVADVTAIAPAEMITALTTQTIEATTATIAPSKTLHEKFEQLRVMNSKKAFYDEFADRLANVVDFRDSHDGSGLVLNIANQSNAKSVVFSNQNMILDFLDNAIKQGKTIKENFEREIMAFEV